MSIFDLFKKIETETSSVGGPPQWLIVGLGNPGDKYANTRHNAGYRMVEAIADKYHAAWNKRQFQSICAFADCDGVRCLLMKPETFMNLSGQAVRDAMHFYRIPPEQVLVMFDDINLDVGGIRIRKRGSDGGQKGMQNIIYLTAVDTFPRIRIGIGQKPHKDYPLADWVLSQFSKEEQDVLLDTANTVCQAVPMILQGKIELAMSRFNTGKSKPKPSDSPQTNE